MDPPSPTPLDPELLLDPELPADPELPLEMEPSPPDPEVPLDAEPPLEPELAPRPEPLEPEPPLEPELVVEPELLPEPDVAPASSALKLTFESEDEHELGLPIAPTVTAATSKRPRQAIGDVLSRSHSRAPDKGQWAKQAGSVTESAVGS